jgi:hypothetical protein
MTSNGSKAAEAAEEALIKVLRTWRAADPAPGLSERIVAQAMTLPQELPYRPAYRISRKPSLGWLLPRLASLAAGVSIGVLVGLSEPIADEMASGLYSSLFDQPGTMQMALDSDSNELSP